MSDDWLSGSLFGLDTGLQVHSAAAANKTNVKIMRENNAFIERMSNSAIQRRADDFERAGFNRLLAATGPGASTPTPNAATVEPTYRGGAVATAMQLKNLMAQTELTTQEARIKRVEANTAEEFGQHNAATQRGLNIANLASAEQKVIGQEIDNEKAKFERDLTASQLAKFNEMWPVMVQLAKQQARTGEIDLAALENINKMGGVEAGKVSGLFKLLIDLWRAK